MRRNTHALAHADSECVHICFTLEHYLSTATEYNAGSLHIFVVHFMCFFQQRTNDRCKTQRHKPSSFFLEGGHVLIVAISCSMMILFKQDWMFCVVFHPSKKYKKHGNLVTKTGNFFFEKTQNHGCAETCPNICETRLVMDATI